MSPLLAAASGILIIAALRELWAAPPPLLEGARRRGAARLVRLGGRLPLPGHGLSTGRHLRQAGLEGRLDPRAVPLARAGCLLSAVPLALTVAPAAPGRSAPLALVAVPAAAGLIPDLVLERLARRRLARIAAGLPAALELIAVAAASGRGTGGLLGLAADAADGPLREELLGAVAELECGGGTAASLRALGERGGGGLAVLAMQLERSQRLGSPLAERLQEQAASLREATARRIEEDAARAAPKIQLVVALLLVPSVLLLLAAAALAHADALLGGL